MILYNKRDKNLLVRIYEKAGVQDNPDGCMRWIFNQGYSVKRTVST
jgi:hypothetical protein